MKRSTFFVAKLVFFFSYFFFTAFSYMSAHGFFMGTYLTLLFWSFYILCVPAAHGQLTFGYPIRMLQARRFYTEPLMWIAALGLNIFTIFACPSMYPKSITTHLLYHILTVPNPYWIIPVVSAFGTFYNLVFKQDYFNQHETSHITIRSILIIMGIINLIYFSHKEAILMLNATL